MGKKIESPLSEFSYMRDMQKLEEMQSKYEDLAKTVEQGLTKGRVVTSSDRVLLEHLNSLQKVANTCAKTKSRLRMAWRSAIQLNLIGELIND